MQKALTILILLGGLSLIQSAYSQVTGNSLKCYKDLFQNSTNTPAPAIHFKRAISMSAKGKNACLDKPEKDGSCMCVIEKPDHYTGTDIQFAKNGAIQFTSPISLGKVPTLKDPKFTYTFQIQTYPSVSNVKVEKPVSFNVTCKQEDASTTAKEFASNLEDYQSAEYRAWDVYTGTTTALDFPNLDVLPDSLLRPECLKDDPAAAPGVPGTATAHEGRS